MRNLIFVMILLLAGCKKSKDATASAGQKPSRKKILTGLTITSVSISSFPKYAHDGEQWDAYAPFATDPDLFVSLKWNENVIFKSETRNESPFGTPVAFSTNMPFQIKPFDQKLLLEVFDEDGISSNDNVGYFTFIPTEFKDKKLIELKSGELTVILGAIWIYQ